MSENKEELRLFKNLNTDDKNHLFNKNLISLSCKLVDTPRISDLLFKLNNYK